MRIGTDYTQNYYEYSLPLQVTRQPTAANQNYTVDEVWPVANRVDVAFQKFIDAKAERNAQATSGIDYNTPFIVDAAPTAPPSRWWATPTCRRCRA